VESSVGKTSSGFRPLVVSGFGTARFFYDLPWGMKPSAKYVFFLHGKTVEMEGPYGVHPRFGIYDYHGIVTSFQKAGFNVIGEIRPNGIKLDKYAGKIVRQIETLQANGIPSEQITVVGFSKGNAIALLVSATLMNPKVNYVVMSGCPHKRTLAQKPHKKGIYRTVQSMQGRFLSIYDESDPKCAACRRILKNISDNSTFKKIELKSGMGHRLFYRPRKEWLEPVMEWIHENHPPWIKKQGITSPGPSTTTRKTGGLPLSA
jgi:predicted esterase